MSYIFVDESGQFTKRSSEPIFVLGSFITDTTRLTEKQFRSWQHRKFPRVMRDQSEVKFSDVALSQELKLRTVAFIAKMRINIRYIYLKAENIPLNYWEKNRVKSGELYTHVVGENLKMYTPEIANEFRVLCDQRNLKGITKTMFSHMLTKGLAPLLPTHTHIHIEMKDSTTTANIQIADWIAGALAAYHNNKKGGEKYFQILQDAFPDAGKELFADHWC